MIRYIKGAVLPLSILFAGLLAVAPTANADVIQYYSLAWSGANVYATQNQPNNSVTATGTIGLDLTTLPNPDLNLDDNTDITSSITSLTVTITGAGGYNGTWTLADLAGTYWGTEGATLDMNTQLVGQPTPNGPWGSTPDYLPGPTGDFNLWFSGLNAPGACWYFTMCTGNEGADLIQLTSFEPINAVPEPGSLPLLATGLAVLSLFGLRRSQLGQRKRRKNTAA